MPQQSKRWMASKEVAERLDLHVRTLRNWLDLFVPVSEKQKNPQGHYLISETGFELLKTAKERKDSGNSSLRDIQLQMAEEGLLRLDELSEDEVAASSEQSVVAHPSLQTVLKEVETSFQEALYQFQRELTQLAAFQHMYTTIFQKIADMEEKQESLRLEIRQVMSEMELMHQRLTKRKQRLERYESRWSWNPLKWFTRHDRHLSTK